MSPTILISFAIFNVDSDTGEVVISPEIKNPSLQSLQGITFKLNTALLEQPLASTPVTEYVVDIIGVAVAL
jgi:hypothetical protein